MNVAITKAISTRRMSFQCPCDVIPVLLFLSSQCQLLG
ncbi:hypothetical protein WANA31_0355 [Wolbachia endosymbiont of Drosophila ananassae]|nr:hypothetical protein WANA31_0355 [Wolbachia endosymbiont of Drosophila ananassae]RLT62563.1 hypothetical protein WANA34_0481 [Wolbachia endosymbiont of Drosophila ananassae]